MIDGLDVFWPGYVPWADTVVGCRREFVRVARSFWLIPEIIPPVARDDVALLYCVCRRLDDAIDEAPGTEQARAALAGWRAEILRLTELFLTAWHPRTLGIRPPPPHESALHRPIAGRRGANG
jgi:hypothetical protein